MPITITKETPNFIKGFFFKRDFITKIVTVRGDFTEKTDVEKKLALAQELFINEEIAYPRYLGILRSIKNIRPKEFYSEIGKKGAKIRHNL